MYLFSYKTDDTGERTALGTFAVEKIIERIQDKIGDTDFH